MILLLENISSTSAPFIVQCSSVNELTQTKIRIIKG